MTLFSEMMDEAHDKDMQISSLHTLSFKLRSALGPLCALMEDDIETGKVPRSETRLRCLIEARSLLES